MPSPLREIRRGLVAPLRELRLGLGGGLGGVGWWSPRMCVQSHGVQICVGTFFVGSFSATLTRRLTLLAVQQFGSARCLPRRIVDEVVSEDYCGGYANQCCWVGCVGRRSIGGPIKVVLCSRCYGYGGGGLCRSCWGWIFKTSQVSGMLSLQWPAAVFAGQYRRGESEGVISG